MPTLLRRDQAIALATALLALVGCAPAPAQTPTLTPSPAPPASSPAPPPAATAASDAKPEALRGLGKLAFVQGGHLFLLVDGTVRAVAHQGQASAPAWSGDGRWVAFRTTAAGGQEQIAIAGLDGNVQVVSLPGGGGFAWSPTGATLALSPNSGARGLWLVEPGGVPRPLAAAGQSVDMIWAPDGKSLAYALVLPFDPSHPEQRSDAIFTVPTSGGEPTQHYVAPHAGIRWVGWWPDGKGVLFWQDPMHSASLAADGSPLLSLALPGSNARLLEPGMLAIRPSWAPDGKRLTLTSGGGRELWRGHAISICTLAAESCKPVAQPDDMVSLEPAWSPSGDVIAFVRAPRLTQPVRSAADQEAWLGSRSLWLVGADGQGARAVAGAAKGVFAPTWARDGHHLLYVSEGALWLIDTQQPSTPTRLATLVPPNPSVFYGRINWDQVLAFYPEG